MRCDGSGDATSSCPGTRRRRGFFRPSFTLEGEVSNANTFEPANLRALPTEAGEVTFSSGGEAQTRSYTGVLYELLSAAEPTFDEGMNNDVLSCYVRIRAHRHRVVERDQP